MSYIDPGVSVTEAEKSVINKWGFELRSNNNNHFVLSDPALKAKKKGKYAYVGGNLQILFVEIMAARQTAGIALPADIKTVLIVHPDNGLQQYPDYSGEAAGNVETHQDKDFDIAGDA